jgi:predicted Fe-S protein YdhL (DUF1289 family)
MDDSIVTRVAPVAVTSPCVLVCTLDTKTGWCLGCGRTGEEIAGWTRVTDGERRMVLSQLPERMAKLRAS